MSVTIHFVGGEAITVAGNPTDTVQYMTQGPGSDADTWAFMDLEHGMGEVAVNVSAVTHVVAVPEAA